MSEWGSPLTRFEDSLIIGSSLDSAPHIVVNTECEAEKRVASSRLGAETDSLIFGRPNRIIAIGGNVRVSDCQSVAIFCRDLCSRRGNISTTDTQRYYETLMKRHR